MTPFRLRAALVLWRALPALSVLGCVLLAQALAQAEAIRGMFPPLAFMAAFYWAILFPRRFSYGAAFALGMVSDVLTGGLLGASALLWMGLKRVGAGVEETLEAEGFIVTWSFFSIALLIAMLLEWATAAWLQGVGGLPPGVTLSYSAAVLCYPAFHRLMGRLRRAMYRKVWFAVKEA